MDAADVSFDRYYRYDEIMSAMKALQEEYSELMQLGCMGRSHAGRAVPVMTVTAAGDSSARRPALYVDGNMHAGEVTGSMACLYLIRYLAGQYGEDDRITGLLRRRTFYVAPRVNPDGAEKYLTGPHYLRSSVRPYPDDRLKDRPGLHPADVDGDGRILTMRVRDDRRGGWKKSARDCRLMVERLADDREGPFYHLYREGFIKDYRGYPFDVHSTPWGLDTNRNFPSNWSTDLPGGGPYPTSEPEVKNIIDFVLKHPNIAGVQALHTTGGIIFRSPYVYPDEEMNRTDYEYTVKIARRGTEYTGYPDVSSYSGPYAATIVDWAYETQGLIAYTPELWDLNRRAGIERDEGSHRPPAFAESEERGIKLLRFSDRYAAGAGFIDWHEAQHPQLGRVEIGGWEPKFFLQNPPPALLEGECRKIASFLLSHAEALPEVRVDEMTCRQVRPGVFSIEAVISNHGYLPTSVTQKAQEMEAVREVTAELHTPSKSELLSGRQQHSIGHLDGYGAGRHRPHRGSDDPGRRARRLRWIIRAESGEKVTLRVDGQRSGQHEETVSL